jgi:hypothetical protein
MKTYRIYGEYIQRVYIDIAASDSESAQDIAADAIATEWTVINKPEIDITDIDYPSESDYE